MITSTANAQVKNVINLIKKSGERRNRGLFVIEGIRMFSEVPGKMLEKVYASESFAKDHMSLLNSCGSCGYEIVSDNVFKQMSDTKTPQGIMALVKVPEYSMEDLLPAGKVPLLVVLENIQDPGNLGTIIRTAEGAGATGIIMSNDTVDIYNPKTIRSTMGSLFRMPFIYAESISGCVENLNAAGIRTMAAHLDGTRFYYEEDLSVPLAVLIGNEGNGLTKELTGKASCLIKIPMEGRLESLNAAVSTAIILYETSRQRRI